MSGDRLPCGHPNGWMLRLRDGPKLFKYCWGCIIAKAGVDEVFTPPVIPSERTLTKEQERAKVAAEAAIVKPKKEK